jgi:hypothetical protein
LMAVFSGFTLVILWKIFDHLIQLSVQGNQVLIGVWNEVAALSDPRLACAHPASRLERYESCQLPGGRPI